MPSGCSQLATLASGTPSVALAWIIFAAITIALALFLLVVMALLMVRRARTVPPRPRNESPGPDAWREAGRRARPWPTDGAEGGEQETR